MPRGPTPNVIIKGLDSKTTEVSLKVLCMVILRSFAKSLELWICVSWIEITSEILKYLII